MASGTIKKHRIQYDVLLGETSINGTGNKSLSYNINDYDYLLFGISNGSEWKFYEIPSVIYEYAFDVSWNATDNTGWYIIVTVLFSGTSLTIAKFQRGSFSSSKIRVYGVKVS